MKYYKEAIICFTFIFLVSCESRRTAQSVQDWREMDTLAITMENVFRPLKDSSTVDAATRLMAQIADESEKLAASKLPDKVNNETIKMKLEKLKTDTRALANEIATGTEEDVIGTDFYKIHDLYQEIHDTWKK
jgi:hypothetical protein